MVVQGKRGAITDRNGSPLAVSIDSPSIAAYPRRIADRGQAAKQLAGALNQPRREDFKKLAPKRSFVWLKRQATPRQAEAVRDLGIKGRRFHHRAQPLLSQQNPGGAAGGLFRHRRPRPGGTWSFISMPISRAGSRRSPSSRMPWGAGSKVPGCRPTWPRGNNVVLTIDRTIQHIAQKALETSVTQFKARSGMAIVMAPATGEVLALAHYPFFNPNSYTGFRA
jgi:cell division protein FtsI (penicillin-binding protein 3)